MEAAAVRQSFKTHFLWSSWFQEPGSNGVTKRYLSPSSSPTGLGQRSNHIPHQSPSKIRWVGGNSSTPNVGPVSSSLSAGGSSSLVWAEWGFHLPSADAPVQNVQQFPPPCLRRNVKDRQFKGAARRGGENGPRLLVIPFFNRERPPPHLHGTPLSSHAPTLPTTPPSVWRGSAALRAIVLRHVVSHPVDFGGPALSQGLVEFLTELLQRLVVRFTQSQRVLRRRETRRRQG